MFTISIETRFAASHQLTLPDGSKEPIHQHDWTVTASVSSDKLNPTGVVIDFRRLRSILDNILEEFNNILLNDAGCFDDINPTAENVAKYIYQKLKPELPKGVELAGVTICEEAGCLAEFQEDSPGAKT